MLAKTAVFIALFPKCLEEMFRRGWHRILPALTRCPYTNAIAGQTRAILPLWARGGSMEGAERDGGLAEITTSAMGQLDIKRVRLVSREGPTSRQGEHR